MDPHLSEQRVGSRISLVALVDGIENNTMQCVGISPQQSFSLLISGGLALGKYTFYGLVVRETGTHVVCEADQSTRCFHHGSVQFHEVSIFDVCSGIGGFTLGSERLGMHTCAFIESNDLACKALRSNYAAPVIQGSICDEQVVRRAHELRPAGFTSPADFLVNLTQDKVTRKVWPMTEVKH